MSISKPVVSRGGGSALGYTEHVKGNPHTANTSKETCVMQRDPQKRLTHSSDSGSALKYTNHVKRDPRKRNETHKRDERTPAAVEKQWSTHQTRQKRAMYMQRDPQKRPTYSSHSGSALNYAKHMKRDLRT